MPLLDISGSDPVSIHYETHGNFVTGEKQHQTPLLYIPGLGSDSASWTDTSSRLAAARPLVVSDNRGCGRSSQPTGDYSIETMTSDLVAILDHLELDLVHIVGHSMGGFLAMSLAAMHPGRVSGLVLSNTVATFGARNSTLLSMWLEAMRSGVDPEWITADLAMWLYSPQCFTDPGFLPAVVADIMSAPYPQTYEGFAGQSAACINFDGNALARRIASPTLVIWGAQDILTTPAQAQHLADSIPGARSLCIDNAAHLPQREQPEVFSAAVLDFLDECEAGEAC